MDSLASYHVLDTPADPRYDAVTLLAARLCKTPFAAISFVDASRQWFKSTHGLALPETPRELSLCSDVVAVGTAVEVSDAAATFRHRFHPLVADAPFIRGYLGVPLVGRDGLPLGALCVGDTRPRNFSTRDVEELTQLSQQVVALLEQDRRDHYDGLFRAGVVADARDSRQVRKAFDDGEFVNYYQPIVDIHNGRPRQLEALLRWKHPVHGTLSPAAFMPAVEASALVVPLGRSVLDAALAQLAELDQHGLRLHGGVAVNVASGQLARIGLARDVITALERHHVDGQQLTLEITEATDLPDLDVARAELNILREIGVHIAIDDFGVGWSNLTRITQLPVDQLKIDRSIASAALTDPRSSLMVASTVALAKSLGLQVTAEGVETAELNDHLARLGCDQAQGWLYSRAVEASTIGDVVRGLQAGHRRQTARLYPFGSRASPIVSRQGDAAPWRSSSPSRRPD